MKNLNRIYFLACLLTALWLCVMFYLNEVPVDTSDGLQHFYLSQASWSNPALFLDHWGKPLFILLSSPFAQFGFIGMFVFNLLVYLGICWIAFRVFTKFKVNILFASLFPIILVSIYEFSTTILGGLTEPLFNLAVLFCFWLFIEKKWTLFALVISLTPYIRSEGQLVFLLGIGLLLVYKQFKYLPFVLIFPLVYSLAGILVFDDFWWYFTKSAYSYSNNIYGHGPWNHYLVFYKAYLSFKGLLLFLFSLPVILYLLIQRKWEQLKFAELVFAYGIFIAIVIFHSYLWANGKYGSLGLTRIATQGMPLFLVMAIYYCNQVSQKINSINLFFCLAILFCSYKLVRSEHFPIKASIFDKQVMLAANYLKTYKSNLKKIHYHHPLISYQLGYNPFRDKAKINFYYGHQIEKDFDRLIQKGDILVWDSKFGPVESGMPLKKILALKLLAKINSFSFYTDKNIENGVQIFQYEKHEKHEKERNVVQKTMKDLNYSLNPKLEFLDVMEPKLHARNQTINLSINLKQQTDVLLICTNENNVHYQAKELLMGKNEYNFTLLANSKYKLYFWNKNKQTAEIHVDSLQITQTVYPKIKL